jgi:hypothetical protein
MGRYVQTDPLEKDVNYYLYVANNPPNLVDALGLQDSPDLGLPSRTYIPMGTPGGPSPKLLPNLRGLLNDVQQFMLLWAAGNYSQRVNDKVDEFMYKKGLKKAKLRICRNYSTSTLFVIEANENVLSPRGPGQEYTCGKPFSVDFSVNRFSLYPRLTCDSAVERQLDAAAEIMLGKPRSIIFSPENWYFGSSEDWYLRHR